MKITRNGLRTILCATTAISFIAAAAAHAQSAGGINLNLGSVVATGDESSASNTAAPSGTGSVKQAQKLEKLSPNIVSVRPQSEIAQNPDVNLADAFARVPGVELVSDSGEGEFINIRGLDADLNGTTFDGIHLTANVQSTPTGGGRATDLSAFPAGIVGGVEVVKSITPEMDAEGLGGSANLLPITLPDNGNYMANITLAGGIETLRPTPIYQGSFTIGDHFAIPGMRSFANAKPFAFILAYTNYSDRRGIDDFEEDYDSNTITAGGNQADLDTLQYRYYQEHRMRQGFYGELDFDPTPITGFYVRALQGGYTVDIAKDRLQLSSTDAANPIGGTGIYTVSGVTPSARYTFQDERVISDVLEAGGHTTIANKLAIDAKLSYEQGSDVLPYDYVSTFKGSKIKITYNDQSPNYRTYTTNVDLTNPSLYTLSSISNTPQRFFDQEWAAAANAALANAVLGGQGVAKFGLDVKLRAEGGYQSEFDGTSAAKINLGNVTGSNPSLVYYNSHFGLPPFVAYDQIFPLLTFAPNLDTVLSTFQHNSENVYAAYAQETLEFNKFELLFGARVEDTNGTYHANLNVSGAATTPKGAITTADGSVYDPNTNKQDYINVFPSLQLKYKLSDRFQLRAVYSTAIARPGFQEISAAGSLNVGGASNGENAVTVGNTDLKPTTGNSIDVTAEYYGPHDTHFSADIFDKFFNNYIYQTGYFGTFQGAPAEFTSYQNETAFARGIELDATQRLYWLPAPFDGFGIDANATFVDSRGRSDGPATKAYQLPETAPLTYNAQLSYEKGPVDLSVSANYVARSLFQVFGTRDTDVFTSARITVDADGAYAITPRVTFFVSARNLANSPLEFTQSASSHYPIQREFYNADYLAGIRLKLGS